MPASCEPISSHFRQLFLQRTNFSFASFFRRQPTIFYLAPTNRGKHDSVNAATARRIYNDTICPPDLIFLIKDNSTSSREEVVSYGIERKGSPLLSLTPLS